jgi:hypothetical protein
VAEWQVQRGSPLDLFLRGQGVQQWRIPVLVTCGGVKVFRGNAELPLDQKLEKTHIKQFDRVRLVEPTPRPCAAALQREINTASRDYAMVPGTSPFDVAMGRLMQARPDTIRLMETDLIAFLKSLGRSPAITHPIRSLIVASHASDEGNLIIKMGSISGRSIEFEDLEDALKKGLLRVDVNLIAPRPVDKAGARIIARLLIRGCRIGKQPEFLLALRQAMGNLIPVAAPNHFHVATAISKPPGFIEYMAYSFPVTSPTRLRDAAAVVAALQRTDHKFIDKSLVPVEKWRAWVPSNPNKPGDQRLSTTARTPVGGGTIALPRWFRHKERFLFKNENALQMPSQSTKPDDRKQAVRDELTKIDFFKASSRLPVFKRYGYESVDEFMDGWTWVFKPKGKAPEVRYNAVRYEYTVIQPVTEVKTGELILNFYPTTKKGSVVERLKITDDRMFTIV